VHRLRGFQHGNGLFSIWCGGTTGLDITARVAHRLMAFQGLPYPSADYLRERAAAALLARQVRDNQLLALHPNFADRLVTSKDAVALYFYGQGRRDEALDFLRRTSHRSNGAVYWEGRAEYGYWGGNLEATCDAARVLLDAGDPLLGPAFKYVGAKTIGGGLHSTADTRALVELLAAMPRRGEARARIDGREVRLADETIGQAVTALDTHLLVRVDEAMVLDHLAPQDNFRFSVDVAPSRLKLGERTWLTIRLHEDSLCPLARIYLPGCLALLKGGANAQTAHLPVGVEGTVFCRDARLLTAESVAVRKGHGQLRVAVHDLYDAQKVGSFVGPSVTVG
jgi:hypothetical protein